MPDLTVTWTISDQEFAFLSRLVEAEGKGERVEAYAGRVGFKGLKGALEAQSASARQRAIDALGAAYDAADDATKAKALDPLGFVLLPDGSVVPK